MQFIAILRIIVLDVMLWCYDYTHLMRIQINVTKSFRIECATTLKYCCYIVNVVIVINVLCTYVCTYLNVHVTRHMLVAFVAHINKLNVI